jgi:hypothetical protein
MKSLWSRFRAHAAAILTVTVVVLLGCEAMSQGKPDVQPVALTGEVAVTIKDNKIQLYPRVSFVRPRGSLTFKVDGLAAGQTLELDFKVTTVDVEAVGIAIGATRKGPFARNKQEPRGRVTLTAESPSATLTYDVVHKDAIVWKYEMALRDREGNDIDVIDPATVGKGDG